MTVPLPEGLGVGDELGVAEGVGDEDGFGDWEGFGDEDGAGVVEGFGDADGVGVIEGEGLGKLAATEKVLPKFPALLEKRPKTDWFRAKRIRVIKNDVKKYAFLISKCHPHECEDPRCYRL